jgi:hypothetical protein
MTRHYDTTQCEDALHDAICATKAGLVGFALYFGQRRGDPITTESLRKILRRTDGKRVHVDTLRWGADWLADQKGADDSVHDWLHALAAEQGYALVKIEPVEPEPVAPYDILAKGMMVTEESGALSKILRNALSDLRLCLTELDAVLKQINKARRMLDKLEAMAKRFAKGRAA